MNKFIAKFSEQIEGTISAAATEAAQRAGRPVQFLRSNQVSKEE